MTKQRFKLSVEEYLHYQKHGYLIVKSLVSEDDVNRLLTWADDLLYGRISIPGIEDVGPNTPLEELINRFSRVHMLHRSDETAEWALLHSNILDVLEGLIGPDVLSLQSMLFFNPPGKGGQGWHQDSFYIPTYPDSLIGSWLALERADEQNGCLWVVPGSHHEPIYPAKYRKSRLYSDEAFDELLTIENVSHLDDEVNTLAKVAKKYPDPIPVVLEPGDVLFFHSHLLHRSYPNRTTNRFRRSFVSHYCSAHSLVPWNHGAPFKGVNANHEHILARGSSHLPFATPAFGTPVKAKGKLKEGEQMSPRMMGMESGQMVAVHQSLVVSDDFGESE